MHVLLKAAVVSIITSIVSSSDADVQTHPSPAIDRESPDSLSTFGNKSMNRKLQTECQLSEGCPLCDCVEDDDACLLDAAVKVCTDGPSICLGDFGIDEKLIKNFCNVFDCDNPPEDVGAQAAVNLCRACGMYKCCEVCPSNRFGECFPPTDDGFIPTDWQPSTCTDENSGRRLLASTSISSLVAAGLMYLY